MKTSVNPPLISSLQWCVARRTFSFVLCYLSMCKSVIRQDNLLSRLQIGDLVCKTVWNGVMVVSMACQTKKAEKKLVNLAHLVYDIIGGFGG